MGYSEAVVRRHFAYDDEFPAIKWGKSYIVLKEAFMQYCCKSKR